MKIKFFLIASVMMIAAMFSNSYSQQDVNGWYWLNGQPMGNTVQWAQVIDAANIIAVGNRGIFMKSTDGGDSWTLTQAGAPDLGSTGNLAKRDLYTGWFLNPTTGIVAGATQTGTPSKTVVSKTTDGGVTWTIKEVNSTAGGSVNDIYFINSTTGYLCGATNARLYKTTDQGETWTNISSIPANTYYSMHAFDENNILLGTSSRRIVRTTDGGTTWITDTLFSAATNVQFLGMTFKDANTGYVIGNPNYFAYTTNAGANWTASTHSSIRGQRSIVYDNGKVWTAGDYEWVYSSTNDGMNWDSVRFYDNSNVNQPTPFIIYGIGANGNDLVVVGNGGQVTTSNDGGASWRNKNYSVSNGAAETYSAMYVESENGRIWAAPNGGGNMLYSTNGGTNWATQTTAHVTSIFTIDFVNSNTGFICGGNAFSALGQMSVTTNGGANWNLLTLPSPINVNQLNNCDFVDENTGWVTGGSGPFGPVIVYKTTDGGATWSAQSLPNAPTGLGISVQMVDANYGYLKTSNTSNQLYYTTDGGTNWIRNTTSQATTISHSNMFVLNKDVIYLNGNGSGGFNKVIRSLDGGMTWTDITSNILSTFTAFKTKWINTTHGIVSGTNGYMAKTTDGGLSWTASNPGISTTVDCALPNKNAWFAVSDRNGFYPISKKTESVNTISLNIYGIVEGFWNGTMQCADTVRVQLRSSSSPYGVVEEATGIISTTLGYASVEFTTATTGSYYIVVKHRNALETWSAAPVALTQGASVSSYDFTSAASQSYGGNTVLKLGKYCFYSGDVNQDGIIDASDASAIDNDAFNFVSGYTSTDVNCDGFVDASDGSITDNNVFNVVTVQRP